MAYNLISTITVGAGGAGAIDFNNIPGTYTDLLLVISIRGNGGASFRNLPIRLNTDSGSNYYQKLLGGSGSGSGSSASYGSTGTEFVWGVVNDTNTTSNTFSNLQYYIPNYTSSGNKTISFDGVAENNAVAAEARMSATNYYTSSAITRIYIYPETNVFLQYSTASLYGIK